MESEASEEIVVSRAKQGDKAALGELMFGSYDDLARFLTPRLPAAAQRHLSVDDLVQQVFAKAFRDFDNFEYRGAGSFSAWLRSIGEYRLRDALKELQRKKRGGDRVQIDPATASMANVLAVFAGDDPTASRILRHDEARQAMHQAIEELPDDYREVVRLRFFELKSIEETSQLMNRSPASVRALADRAKKQLRDALGRISTYLSTRGY